jgi:hypothetical protein
MTASERQLQRASIEATWRNGNRNS